MFVAWCCNVCVAVILVTSRCLRLLFVMRIFASLFVMVVLLVLFVLLAMFDGLRCSLLRVVMYAWRLSWSCVGVCGRCSFCPLLLRL